MAEPTVVPPITDNAATAISNIPMSSPPALILMTRGQPYRLVLGPRMLDAFSYPLHHRRQFGLRVFHTEVPAELALKRLLGYGGTVAFGMLHVDRIEPPPDKRRVIQGVPFAREPVAV